MSGLLNGTANSGSGLFSVSEVSALGVPLMPNGTAAGGRQLDSSFLANGRAIVIDMSGNVWLAGNGPVGTPSQLDYRDRRSSRACLSAVLGGSQQRALPEASLNQYRMQKKPRTSGALFA